MSKKRNQLETLKSYIPVFKEFYLSPEGRYKFMIDSVIMDGEHHPEGYNFMGKGSQNANRAGLTYTGKTGTKNYWLARDKHDRVSLEHDLLYYDDRNW